jgi:hypothetical protein
MTIVVAVATPDGLVLAADSRTTSFPDESDRSRVASDTTEKVSILCGRFALATFGDAFIGESSITSLLAEFAAQFQQMPADAEELAGELATFFDKRFMKHAAPNAVGVGFIVGGYGPKGVGYLYEVEVPGRTCEVLEPNTGHRGMVPRGQRGVIDRLMEGVDRELLEDIEIEVPPELDAELERFAYIVQIPITLQDGIDFARFLIRTTIDMQRFSDGTKAYAVGLPLCGGPTRIAVVRRQEAEWVTPPVLRANNPVGRGEGALDY